MTEEAPEGMTRVGHYRLVRELSRGERGPLWEALDERDGRRVALKLLEGALPGRPSERPAVRAQVELLVGLSHPHLVCLHEAGEWAGRPYLVMELVEGISLSQLLRRTPGGRLPLEEGLRLARQLLCAVAFLEERGIVHRDVTPANVLLDTQGNIKLADFELVARVGSDASDGAIMGTPAYMAPEQARGETDLDSRTDLYGVGAVLYRLLSGARPREGERSAVLRQLAANVSPPPLVSVAPEVPAPLARLVRGLLAPAREDRYPSAAAALHDLEAWQKGGLVLGPGEAQAPIAASAAARPPASENLPPAPPRQFPTWLSVASGVLIGLVVSALVLGGFLSLLREFRR